MGVIHADANGVELGYLRDFDLDVDVGGDNDFELVFVTDKKKLDFGYRIYENGTEYGGIIDGITVDTGAGRISYHGQTWRGKLMNYIIIPPSGEDYKIVSGNLSTVISGLLSELGLSALYIVGSCTESVNSFQFDRYCTLLDGILKMLKSVGYRLNIVCVNGAVTITPVPIQDYSDNIELSQDIGLQFKVTDDRGGVNHLVCLGTGELRARQVMNLYVGQDGTIGTTQYYTGSAEKAAVYDCPNAESLTELENGGRKRLSELVGSKTFEISIEGTEVNVGDIVGGRERVTGLTLSAPVTRKIVKINDYSEKISYEIG